MTATITTPTRRPSAGFALHAEIETTDPGALARAVKAIDAVGAELVELVPAGRTRTLTIACASEHHQSAVRGALCSVLGVRVHSIADAVFRLHQGGKLSVESRVAITGPSDLAMAYTPGVGRVSSAIAYEPELVWTHTGRANAVAVLTDGSAVLGLGDIGPEAAMPVMEGKAALFKKFGGIDAYPICIRAASPDDVVAVAKAIAPSFGGINLEDIAAPACFEIEERLRTELDIPVFHDDQHGTAIVTLAALENAARVVGKELCELTVAVIGTGAAGVACAKLISHVGVADVIGVDRAGILHDGRIDRLTASKRWFVEHGNRDGRTGGVHEALKGADVLLGLSGRGVIDPSWLADLADDAIVFAMANPVPEVMPEDMPPNVAVVATGRSDYPNQINNVLAFPGVFRGLLDVRATTVSEGMKLAAARALAGLVPVPCAQRIVPGVFDPGVAEAVAAAVRSTARAEGSAR
jgi:malate dehydrogenase (oxaloacetate-decarboxylating)